MKLKKFLKIEFLYIYIYIYIYKEICLFLQICNFYRYVTSVELLRCYCLKENMIYKIKSIYLLKKTKHFFLRWKEKGRKMLLWRYPI